MSSSDEQRISKSDVEDLALDDQQGEEVKVGAATPAQLAAELAARQPAKASKTSLKAP